MELTMLGTGNALVTECYNTCFVLQEDQQYFMVDGGGGSTILHQLKYAGINWKNLRKNMMLLLPWKMVSLTADSVRRSQDSMEIPI